MGMDTITTERQTVSERLRDLYNEGYGVLEIMEMTGKPYIEVQEHLRKARTNLITGGPHDLEECAFRHNHRVITYNTWRLEHPSD